MTDMDSVNKKICLASDLIMVRPKKVANDLKIGLIRLMSKNTMKTVKRFADSVCMFSCTIMYTV